MNIQQYYRTVANTSLNGSFAALVPVFIVIFPMYLLFPQKELVVFTAPFLFYSFISYQSYLVHQERAVESEPLQPGSRVLFDKDKHLLTFLPAPSLRMLLFSPEGFVNGEIRDLRNTKLRWFLPYFLDKIFPAEYGLYNAEDNLIAICKWKGRRKAHVYDGKDNSLFTLEKTKTGVKLIVKNNVVQEMKVDSKKTFTDIQFTTLDGLELGRVRKGWMPLEWGKSFKDANTPVLSFHEKLTEAEKISILTYLIQIYRYRNH